MGREMIDIKAIRERAEQAKKEARTYRCWLGNVVTLATTDIPVLCDYIEELEQGKAKIEANAIELFSYGVCEKHSTDVKAMSFGQYQARLKGLCLFCQQDRIEELEKALRLYEITEKGA